METLVKQLPTIAMAEAGTSPWLDSISRELLKSGALMRLIKESGVLGVTSNPSIFEKAISDKNGGYDADIRRMFKAGASTLEIYDDLTTSDVRSACDQFKSVAAKSKGEHGFVSLEVRPDLAHDAKGTVADAVRLAKKIKRSNLMIKVPATPAGVEAFRELVSLGINVNVTLIFSLKQYLDILHAYIDGLELLHKKGGDVSKVHSVASVFVSRYDAFIDARLAQLAERETDAGERKDLEALKGKAALANSKVIYDEFEKVCSGKRFQKLKAAGANAQKVLWASTGVKNPAYPDLLYVETLIGPETVNTMPSATLDAVLDHGAIEPETVRQGMADARETVKKLKTWGIDLEEIGSRLQHDGLIAFEKSFDDLMRTIELHCESAAAKVLPVKYKYSLPAAIRKTFPAALLKQEAVLERILKADASLWKNGDAEHQEIIKNRLGWLRIADTVLGGLYVLDQLKADLAAEKIKDLVLLGMGGSSLAPEVMSLICEKTPRPGFRILDSTDPAEIRTLENRIDLKKTVFIVSSKSGSTVETLSQYRYFFDKVSRLYRGKEAAYQAGRHFVAVTDDGSRLEKEAYENKFRKVFINPSNIGGRYSALSYFGLVPAALMGVDVRSLVKQARGLLTALAAVKDPAKEDSIAAGVLLAELAVNGSDKLTIWTDKKLRPFGSWLEQLIAESTGKEGRGILPVDQEEPAAAERYSRDRVFLVLTSKGAQDADLAARVKAVKKAGLPVIECVWPQSSCLGAEFLRWEIATAVAASVLGVNPFDEPNVRESKDNTTRLLSLLEKEGRLKSPENLVKVSSGIDFRTLLNASEDEYFALLAFVERSAKTDRILARIQKKLRNGLKNASLRGFGPRYLHSIGQFYKGGPAKGRFIYFVQKDAKDLKIPGARFSFAELKQAQAFGDIQAIIERERPCMTVDLGKDPAAGLETFEKQLTAFLKS